MDPGPSLARLLVRGLRRRCPYCGTAGVFETWFRMAERCPACANRLVREPGFFLGAYFLNICLTQLVLAAWVAGAFALTWPDPPLVPIAAGAVVVAVVVPMLAYPFAKSTWSAVHLALAPLDPDEEADAAAFRFERGDAS